MKIYLRDINPAMVRAWMNCPWGGDVQISCGDIFEGPAADVIVSPSNSYGFMDGGIDAVYSDYFGPELQQRLQRYIRDFNYGELPVGQAIMVPTNNGKYPRLIAAPTMRVPMSVKGTLNAYLAFRAALRLVVYPTSNVMGSILCPGLCTSVGEMPPEVCAGQMYFAYRAVIKNDLGFPVDLREATMWDAYLKRVE